MTEYHAILIKAYNSKEEAVADTQFDEWAKAEGMRRMTGFAREDSLNITSEMAIVDLGIQWVGMLDSSEFADYSPYQDHAWLHQARVDVWMEDAFASGLNLLKVPQHD
jgi:hypothetical protein